MSDSLPCPAEWHTNNFASIGRLPRNVNPYHKEFYDFHNYPQAPCKSFAASRLGRSRGRDRSRLALLSICRHAPLLPLLQKISSSRAPLRDTVPDRRWNRRRRKFPLRRATLRARAPACSDHTAKSRTHSFRNQRHCNSASVLNAAERLLQLSPVESRSTQPTAQSMRPICAGLHRFLPPRSYRGTILLWICAFPLLTIAPYM